MNTQIGSATGRRKCRWIPALLLAFASPLGSSLLNAAAPPTGTVVYSRAGSPEDTIWLAAADGSADVRLTTGEWPRLSADGRYLVFHRGDATYSRADVWVRDLTTGTETKVFTNPSDIVFFDWTPDGAKLVFDYSCDIRQMNRDGTNIKTIVPTSDCYDDAPAVNPVDGRLTFHNTHSGLWIANADGSGRTKVANTTGGATPEVYPAWSPDGARIAFQVGSSYAVINVDGSGRTDLLAAAGINLTHPQAEAPAAWSPDGNWLVFGGTVNGTNGLFAVATDGSGALRQIPASSGASVAVVGNVSAPLSLAGTANLSLNLAVLPAATVGQPLELTSLVRNGGPAVATITVVTNALPAGLRFVSASASRGSASVAADGSVIGNFGNLAVGDSATLTVTVVPTNAAFLTITATAASTSPSLAGPQAASASVLALVGTVGTIGTPGQRDTYVFSLPTPQRYYFDALYAPADTRWTLSGPEGTVVSARSFSGSDGWSVSDGNAVLNLVPGDYTLSVDIVGAATNSYGFNFMNLADAPLLAPGATNFVDFTPANRTWQWQFPANSGDAVQFQALARTNLSNLSWRLVNPLGQVTYSSGFQNSPVITLLGSGTWTVLLEGHFSNADAGTCAFALNAQGNTPPTLPAGTAFNLGDLVTGTLAANTTNVHRFTLTQAATAVFDSRTNVYQIFWSLEGPFGQVVPRSNFRDSDYAANAPVLALAPGDYALSVTGNSGYAGSYAFRLFDFASASPISPGTEVTGTLSPANATTGHRLSITAGERLFFKSPGGFPGNPMWRLVDPFGEVVFSTYLNTDQGPFTFTVPGTYTLLIEGGIYDTAPVNYSFVVLPVTDGSQVLVLATTVSGNIGQPGQIQRYTFSLAQPARVYFDSLTNQVQVNWTLDGPAGREVDRRNFRDCDGDRGFSLLDLAAGDYTLAVAANGELTPGYSFRLLDLAKAAPIATDTDVAGSLNPANSTAVLSLNIPAGARLFFDTAGGARGNAYWRLVDRFSQVVFAGYLNTDQGPVTFANAGSYALFVEGDVSETGTDNYSIRVVTENDGTQPLTLGATVNGAIALPGQVQVYTFSLAATNRLYFDALTNQSQITWTLDGPAGRMVDHRSLNSSDGYRGFFPLQLTPGNYSLTLDANGDFTGGYAFRLLDFAAATAIATDTPIARTLTPANSTDILKFTEEAGTKLFFNATSASTGSAYWRLLDPYGQVLFANYLNSDQGPFTLDFPGTYSVLVEGDIAATGNVNYSFQIARDHDGNQVLALGSTINGTLTAPGQAQRYTLSLPADTRVAFDALAPAPSLQWTLDGPAGRLVDHRALSNSDGYRAVSWLSLPAGDYVLTITGAGDATGSFAFRLLDLGAATLLTPGSTVTGTLDPATRTDTYRFTAVAGDQVSFTPLTGTSANAFWTLLDPYGQYVFRAYFSTAQPGQTLAFNGAYTLLIEGDINQTAPLAYSFKTVPQGNTPPTPFAGTPLKIGDTINGAIATAGQKQSYTFTLADSAWLSFDALTNANAYVTLTGPTGKLLNRVGFYYLDYNASQKLIACPAGDYQVTLEADAGATTPFSFRLLNVAGATTLVPGTEVSGTATPANATALFAFNGNAGDRLFFDGRAWSGFQQQPRGWLLSPYGDVVMNAYASATYGPFTLPQTGRYVWFFSSRPDDNAASGAYRFAFLPVVYATNALVLGETVNDALESPGQKRFYTFALNSPARLTFDALTNASAYFTLTDPTGTVFNRTQFYYADFYGQKFADCPAGEYTLTIDADQATTTPYRFRVLDFAGASPITVGVEVAGTNTPANATALYTFNGTAGDRLFFDGRGSTGFQQTPRGWLYAPSGNQVISDYVSSAEGPFTLPETGRYVWYLSSLPDDTTASGTYRFAFLPVTDGNHSLTLGATVNGAIASPGQRQFYSFTLVAPTRLQFDTLDANDFLWSITGPPGVVVNQASTYWTSDYYDATPWVDLPAGDYTLTLDLNDTATNSFRFRLLDFATATPFTPDQPVTGQVAAGNATALFRFSANAGDRFYFQWLDRFGYSAQPNAVLVSPLGQVVFRNNYGTDADTFAVPQTGTYTLALQGQPADTGAASTVSFNLVPQLPSVPIALFQTLTVPDLIATDLSASPAGGLFTGQSLTVNWTDRNPGKAAANGSFTDRVTIRNSATGTLLVNRVLFNDVSVNGPLPAGAALPRSLAVTLPNGPVAAGTLEIAVVTDALNNMAEANDDGTGEANNAASASLAVSLASYPDLRVLGLAADPPGDWAPGATVRLSWLTTNAGPVVADGPWSEAVAVRNLTLGRSLFAGVTNDLAGPLAAGESRARSLAFTLPNGGDVYGQIEIAVTTDHNNDVFEYLPGLDAETNNLSVLDVANLAPALSLSLSTNRLVKGESLVATVTRAPAGAVPLVIQIRASDSSRLTAQGTLTLPPGVASATFNVLAVQNQMVEGTNVFSLNVSAPGFVAAARNVTVEDVALPAVTLSLASAVVSEAAGPNATSATVTRSPVSPRALHLAIISANPAAALVPASVTIPANQASASFPVAAVNDGVVAGDRLAAIGGSILSDYNGQPIASIPPAVLTVTEANGPALFLSLATAAVREGLDPATTATVSRNTAPTSALLVSLASSDATSAVVPPTVTIPNGAASTTFNVTSLSNNVSGNRPVTLTASAAGFTAGNATLIVTDSKLPDLVVSRITLATNGVTAGTLAVTFRLENRGFTPVTNAFVQRVFLSSQALAGTGALAAQVPFTGTLPAGQFVDLTANVRLPDSPGNRWVIVTADANNDAVELLEDNNTLVSSAPVNVQPAYLATVAADVHQAVAGTPIPLHGSATLGGTGQPAANVPVTVYLAVRGIQRSLNALTDANGNFTSVFEPLPSEAGEYSIAATFPGQPMPAAQDRFILLGMQIAPIGLVKVTQGSSVSGTTKIANLSEVPLTGLSVQVVTNHPSLAVTANLSTNRLDGDGEITLGYAVTALDISAAESGVVLRVSSDEGVTNTVTFRVRQQLLLPQLAATPSALNGAMLRGSQTIATFTLANNGGAETGPLDLLAPNLAWLSISSPSHLDTLTPGSNTVVTVLFTPPADLPLGDYRGTLVANATNATLSVPFTYRAISDGRGNLSLTAEDEYTYFAAGSPRVTNALVVLNEALSGTPVVTNVTGADGSVLFSNLTEAFYIVNVKADGHEAFKQSAFVAAGMTTNVVAFLPRETVHYTFTVIPTTVQDEYKITVESTFETQVPVPVVTVDPASVDLSQYPGTEFQFTLTLANHGLIAANHVRLNIPSTDRLRFTPLITDIGTLNANSSIAVPVLVERIPAPGLMGRVRPADYLTGQCDVTAGMLWDYLCGPNVVDKSTAVYIFDSTGCDVVSLYNQVYHLEPNAPGMPTPVSTFDVGDLASPDMPTFSYGAPPGFHFECNPVRPVMLARFPRGLIAPASRNVQPADDLPPTNAVCAKVTIRLDQRAVLTRDAFKATLELENDTASALQNVLVNLDLKAADGASANALFGVRAPEVSGFNAIDGTGTLAGQTTGIATWILMPTLDAAPTTGSTLYLVGGTLSYVQDGTQVTVPLAPAPIQVFPQPELIVKYFHQRDVFADDPFTPETEPSLPYSLAMQVLNVGYGTARSLQISSGKPQIVDNVKGLLVDFKTIGTQIESRSLSPALDVNLGEIEPGTNRIARWLFTSSLQGSFTNFSASFQQVDGLGLKRLSLIRSVEVHELNHIVNADRTFDDGRPDMLVADHPDVNHLPDTLYLSDGSSSPVNVVTNGGFSGDLATTNRLTLTANAAAGWTYFRLPNPADPTRYPLQHVLRQDGTEIALGTNVWTTDRAIVGGATRPTWTNQIHLLDYSSAGAYTLVFGSIAPPPADTTPPTSSIAALPASSPARFAISWSGSDDLSGVAFFDIYVSVNGGTFAKWLGATTVNGSIYDGQAGASYAFYSVATDKAGNVQPTPSAAQAQTTVNAVIPPLTLTLGTAKELNAGDTLNFYAQAQGGTPPYAFALLVGTPAGVLINPVSGGITWHTGPADSGTTNSVTVRVTDSASPALSATNSVQLLVRAVNTPPRLDPIADGKAKIGSLFYFTVTAGDNDLPPQNLRFSLGSGAPAGATLDPVTGLFSWRPANDQGPSTNLVTVRVTDDGVPPMNDSRPFMIVVRGMAAQATLRVGHTNLLNGTWASVPLELLSDPDVTEIAFTLASPTDRLLNLQLESLDADVLTASLLPVADGEVQIAFTLAGGSARTERVLADLAFNAAPGANSAILPLTASDLTGRAGSFVLDRTQTISGWVIALGDQPVLWADGGAQPRLTVFGQPGVTYSIYSAPSLTPPADWTPFGTVALETTFKSLPLVPANSMRYFRATGP